MRLPADATLIVLDIESPPGGPSGAPEANIAALLAAWQAEQLPVVRFRNGPADLGALMAATPSEGEPGKTVDGAFANSRLEALLDDIGATTLVLCGSSPLTEATARQAVALGYQVFVPADAVGAPGKDPPDGALEGANIVDTLTTLNAAADAKARQRWQAERSRRP